MFGRRLSIVAGLAVLVPVVSLAGFSPVSAEDYNPQDQCSVRAWNTYGVNCDGWHVVVTNRSRTFVKWSATNLRDMVYDHGDSLIYSGVTGKTVLGIDGIGGPTNMLLRYHSYALPDGYDYYLKLDGDRPECGVTAGDPAGSFASVRAGEVILPIGCEITAAALNEPIRVAFDDVTGLL